MKPAILIKSCQKYAARRKACRETWLKRCEIPYVFVVADPLGRVWKTTETDVLVVEHIDDGFKNIAPKVKHGLEYVLGQGADMVFVCDDDTYVETDRLAAAMPVGQDYVGYLRVEGLGPETLWTPYASGSAYWLSQKAAELVAASPAMMPGIIDDGAVGRVLDGKVHFVHDRRYHVGPVPTEFHPNNSTITTHKCSPADMQHIYLNWEMRMGRLFK